jgi:hypothetical protein
MEQKTLRGVGAALLAGLILLAACRRQPTGPAATPAATVAAQTVTPGTTDPGPAPTPAIATGDASLEPIPTPPVATGDAAPAPTPTGDASLRHPSRALHAARVGGVLSLGFIFGLLIVPVRLSRLLRLPRRRR